MIKVVVLSGAGISAESGIKTFRDSDGLWEGHDVMEVASPDGFRKNPALVLDFYNQRRKQLGEVEPNEAHFLIAKLEEKYDVIVITQNVDDLHERAGSNNVMHLHGELKKARSTGYPSLVYNIDGDINLGDNCEKGFQLRPHIVWFTEEVPLINKAVEEIETAEIVIIVGTSLQVYPAAGLMKYAPPYCKSYYIDLNPAENHDLHTLRNLEIIKAKATDGMKKVYDELQLN